jgi:protein-disulfide isomerase
MKKLVEKRPDIAFYLKLFAIVSPDPQTVKSIICAKSLSMLEDGYEHKSIPKEECQSTELDDNTKFAQTNGITAAPALVFPDGTIQLGYSEAAQLEKRIDEATGKQRVTESPKKAK